MALRRNLIGGPWGRAHQLLISAPLTFKTSPYYAFAWDAQVNDAVLAARELLPGWRKSSPQIHADLVHHVGIALIARGELGELRAREEEISVPTNEAACSNIWVNGDLPIGWPFGLSNSADGRPCIA